MTTSLGGSSGITFPDNTNLTSANVSSIFTPKITNVGNQTIIKGNVEITGDLGIGLYDTVTYNSACRTYTITLKAQQSGDKSTGHGSAQGTTTSGIGMLTDPAMKIIPDSAIGDVNGDAGDITERPPGYYAFRNFNVYTYLWGYYASGTGADPNLVGIPSFVYALQNNIPVKIIVNVESGVVVGSAAWNRYAFDTTPNVINVPGTTPLPYPSGSRCEINLASNSYIVGKGGDGSRFWSGVRGTVTIPWGGNPDDRSNSNINGGYCMRVTIPTTITNYGTISKGGGGGYAIFVPGGYTNTQFLSGGGGGAGFYTGKPLASDGNQGPSDPGTLTGGGGSYGNTDGQALGGIGYTESAYSGTSPTITGYSLVTFAVQGTVLGGAGALQG
jgi:hypothetical protein